MKTLAIVAALAVAFIASPASAANTKSWPKDMLGKWCSGDTDEKGETPYGATTEDRQCHGSAESPSDFLIIQPRSYRYPNANSGRNNVCSYDRLEVKRSADGLVNFTFTATCKDSLGCKWQERATGSAFVSEPLKKGMNIKWAPTGLNECD
jgi:hypothetical protein